MEIKYYNEDGDIEEISIEEWAKIINDNPEELTINALDKDGNIKKTYKLTGVKAVVNDEKIKYEKKEE